MKKMAALFLAIVLCLTAVTAMAETKVNFFTGKIETIDVLNDIINAFNDANPGIVVSQEYQKDASNVIKVKFASGEVPDVMTTYEQEFVDQGKYLALNDMNEWWDRLIPSMRASCTDLKTGNQYRVCTNVTMAGFFYNKEIFNALGLKQADTWDELVVNLTAIKNAMPDVTPLFIFGREAWALGHLIEFIPHGYLKQTLGAVDCKIAMLENDSAKLNFGDPEGFMAVFAQNLLDLQSNGLINEDALTATSDNCVEAFVTGKAAMFSNGMWALSGLLAANPDMADKIGFAPYPAYMPGTQPVVLSAEDSGYSISATTENMDAAEAFLTFLFSPENQKTYSETLGSPSAFLDVDAQWAPAGFAADVKNVLSTAVNIGFTNEKPAGFSGDDAGRMVQDLLAGTYDAQSFAAAYEKAWNDGFGQ